MEDKSDSLLFVGTTEKRRPWRVGLGVVALVAAAGLVLALGPRLAGPDDGVDQARREWSWIVLHHSATTGGNARRFERNHVGRGLGSLAYHFVIGNGSGSGDGEIEIGPNWRRQLPCNHAGNVDRNRDGIAICVVGNFQENTGGPSPAQIEALEGMVRELMGEFGIDPGRVIGHNEVSSTKCPGRYFPIEAFRARLKQSPEQPTVVAGPAGDVSAEPVR